MTDQNNAAQPGLTDDEIFAALRPLYADAVAAQMGAGDDLSTARAIESALLSKLRAEGVQAGDERAALAWYAEQVAGCRKIGADGDAARQALDKDGGRRARAALESATVADESPMAKVADALREKGRQEQQAYQDSRVQSTEWGPMPHGTEADLPASAPVAVLSDEDIREVFLAHGFTIKEGQTDLKPYVYEAARALIAVARIASDADKDGGDCAKGAEDEPIAWESTTAAYIKFITDSRYQKFSPAVRKWYRPYRCSTCAALSPTQPTEQGERDE